MKTEPVQETHHGKEVWVNPTTESIRRDECLCLNCDNLKSSQPANCPIAQSFYEVCVKENVALGVTRCPLWKPKTSQLKKPHVGYHPMLSSSAYVCDGCHGMGRTSIDAVVHNPDCPHYPSEGNRKLEERLKDQDLFKGSKWDRKSK